MIQNNILFPEKSIDKNFKEIKKHYWTTVPRVQENQNAVTFIP